MALLTGAAEADEGGVEVLGMPMPARARGVRSRAGLVPQLDNLDGEITCRDNLEIFARLYGVTKAERPRAVADGLALAQLESKADHFVDQLSGGMRRRLLIARGLLHRPELVLLDEPTVGLDPQIRQELWQTIGAVRDTGATVVLTTHYIEEAERLCDTVAIVHHGRLLALGTPAQLVRDHVGSDVVVEVHGDRERRERVARLADAIGVAHRSAGTSVALFTGSVDALENAAGAGDLDHRTRRPANLEDVFVTLTGVAVSTVDVRFRPDAVAGVVVREWRVFRRVWGSIAFGSVVEPIVYLLAFGYGFGALVTEVAGIPYLDFMATGAAGIGVLFTGFFPGFINGYFRRSENHLYDGLLATPMTIAELVTGEAVWTGIRTAGDRGHHPGGGRGVRGVPGCHGHPYTGHRLRGRLRVRLPRRRLDFVISGVVVPMFVVAGSFFPLDDAPAWLRIPALINPLTHVVILFRAAAFAATSIADIMISSAVVLAFTGLCWVLAVRLLRGAMIR
ncbi:hypothetical protein BH23ACT9_BH23ACT9_20530 [soil metagenome]